VRRDMALKNLIQPLAGEYGMHNNQPQLKTHRCAWPPVCVCVVLQCQGEVPRTRWRLLPQRASRRPPLP
jgi:hypothetical protein